MKKLRRGKEYNGLVMFMNTLYKLGITKDFNIRMIDAVAGVCEVKMGYGFKRFYLVDEDGE